MHFDNHADDLVEEKYRYWQ